MFSTVLNIDKRLDIVCKKIVNRIVSKQDVCSRRISNNYNEEVQFGRFIGNSRVSVSALQGSLYEACCVCCPDDAHLLLIEDTTQVSFSLARKIQGLGAVDKGQVQGFYVHPVLCIDAVDGACYGVCELSIYDRDFEQESAEPLSRSQKQSKRNQELFENKESYRWLGSIEKSVTCLPNNTAKTVVADRESDIYAVLTGFACLGVDYVIRSRHDRVVLGTNKKLSQELATWNTFSHTIDLPATDKRTAHSAKLAISFGQVTLKKGDSSNKIATPKTHHTWVVYAKELPETVVGNEEPIEWILYTSHPVLSLDDALKIIHWYKERWNIEQVFRTLKSKGINIMASLLDSAEKLHKITVLALMACVKVLQLVRARDGKTKQEAKEVFTEQETEFIDLLSPTLEGNTDKLKNPHKKDSLAFAAWVVARLAGWSGYQKQRPPGPIDFLNGIKILHQQYKGYLIAKANITKDVYIP
jgi:hypothetical protein